MSAPVLLSPACVAVPASAPAAAAGPGKEVPRWWLRVSLRSALIGFFVCLVLGLWSWAVIEAGTQAQAVMERARSRMEHLARNFSAHTELTLAGADQVLRFARREFQREGARIDIAASLRRGDLIDAHNHLLTVAGADGEVVDASQPFQRVNLRDREHFRVHTEGRADRMVISRPVVGRISGKTSIQVTRRVADDDGRFMGVVVASLALEVFTGFRRTPEDAGGDVMLAGFDGVVRARTAGTEHEIGHSIGGSTLMGEALRQSSGTMVARSPIDGHDRLYAFHTLDAYGLVAFSGLRMEVLEREIQERRMQLFAVAALLSAVLLAFLGLLLRAERRRQALLERLHRSEQQATAANEMRGRLLRSISHQLRTPLNGVLNYAELIRDTSTDPEAREFGAIVHHDAEHLRALLSTLMELARIESGHLGLQLEPVGLPALLQELIRVHQPTAECRGLVLEMDVNGDAEQSIVTDRARLLQLLNHLVTNALKFTEHGVVRVSLSAEDAGVRILVEDSGTGMAPAQLATLFTRSATEAAVDDAPGSHSPGPGLGLPLARELTELLGGSLHIESQPGHGTQARLWLPFRRAQGAATASAFRVGPAGAGDTEP